MNIPTSQSQSAQYTAQIQNQLNSNGYLSLTQDTVVDSLVISQGQKLNGNGYKLIPSQYFNPTNNPAQAFITLTSNGTFPTGRNIVETTIVKDVQVVNSINAASFNGYGIAMAVNCGGFNIDGCVVGSPANPEYLNYYSNWYDFDIGYNFGTSADGNFGGLNYLINSASYGHRTFGVCATGNVTDLVFRNLLLHSDASYYNNQVQMPLRHFLCTSSFTLSDSHMWGWSYYTASDGALGQSGQGYIYNNQFEAGHFGAFLAAGSQTKAHDNVFGFAFSSDITGHGQSCGLVIGIPKHNLTQSVTGDILGASGYVQGPSFCEFKNNKHGLWGYSAMLDVSGKGRQSGEGYAYSLPGGVVRIQGCGRDNYFQINTAATPPSGAFTVSSTSEASGFTQNGYTLYNATGFNTWIDGTLGVVVPGYTWSGMTTFPGNYLALHANGTNNVLLAIIPNASSYNVVTNTTAQSI